MSDRRTRELKRRAVHEPNLAEAVKVAEVRSAPAPWDEDQFEEFVLGYLEAAIWAAPEDDDGNTMDDLSAEDFEPDARKVAEQDCATFMRLNWSDLLAASEDMSQHGHDFYMTRGGHGVGFWDRKYGDVGERLTEACEPFHENPAFRTETDTVDFF